MENNKQEIKLPFKTQDAKDKFILWRSLHPDSSHVNDTERWVDLVLCLLENEEYFDLTEIEKGLKGNNDFVFLTDDMISDYESKFDVMQRLFNKMKSSGYKR